PYRAWRWTTIALCLFVLSLLAPVIWREVQLVPCCILRPTGDHVEVVEPSVAESLPDLPRMDAYIAPALPSDDGSADPAQVTEVMPEEFASRFGKSSGGETGGGVSPAAETISGDMRDVNPPSEAENYVGVTHGEPADVATHRTVAPTALISQMEALSAHAI